MKYQDVEKQAKKDFNKEMKALGVEVIKKRLHEIDRAGAVLKKLKTQYKALLKEEIQ